MMHPIQFGKAHACGILIGAIGYELWLRSKHANNQGGA